MEAQNRKEYLQELAHKMKEGSLTDEEQAFFDIWYNNYADELLELPEGYARNPIVIRDRMLAKLRQRVKAEQTPVISIFWRRTAAAASILLCLGIGLYEYTLHKDHPATATVAKNKVLDLPPGTNQATLTLANGQKIALTKSLSGKLAQQGNTTINMTSGGEITYTQKDAAQPQVTEVAYNTLTTKRKEQFPLVLADGTKVWLNSSSSITYPVTFNGKEKRVSITGEAYFEVVHNAAQPFRVAVSGQTVEDIGTEFNINAYDDEPVIKTTLINGSVRVTKGSHKAILKPGQAAITTLQQDNIQVKDADIEEAAAWKNGQTLFDDEDIQTIMRQVSRWYDVDVVYE